MLEFQIAFAAIAAFFLVLYLSLRKEKQGFSEKNPNLAEPLIQQFYRFTTLSVAGISLVLMLYFSALTSTNASSQTNATIQNVTVVLNQTSCSTGYLDPLRQLCVGGSSGPSNSFTTYSVPVVLSASSNDQASLSQGEINLFNAAFTIGGLIVPVLGAIVLLSCFAKLWDAIQIRKQKHERGEA